MVDKFNKISLGDRVITLGSLILIAAWLIVAFIIFQERNVEINRSKHYVSSLALVLERHIESTINQLENSLNSLGNNWDSKMDLEKMKMLLQHHVSTQSDLYNLISIIDVSGNVVVTNQDFFAPTFSGDRPFFALHKRIPDSSMLIGSPILGRITQEWYLPVSMRLHDSNGRFAGVVLASVNPHYFSNLFRMLNLGRRSLIYMAGRDGIVFNGISEGKELSLDSSVPKVLARSVFEEAHNFIGIGTSVLDGVERIQCRRLIPGREIFFSVGLDLSESLSAWRFRAAEHFILTFLLSISYVFLLFKFRQSIDSRNKATMELDQFFTSALDLLCIGDTSGRFKRVNPQWEGTLGFSIQDIEGSCFLDYVHPDDIQSTIDAIDNLKAQKSVQNFINRYRNKNNEYRYIEWRAFPHDELIYAAARDITERKEVESVLRQSNETLSLFIKNSPIYTFIKQVSPGESRTLFASDNYYDMIGIKSSEMIGKTMFEIFPDDLARRMTEDDWRVVTQGEILHVDEEFKGRHYSSIKFPIPQGNRVLLAGYTMDVTETMHYQEALREAKDAAEAANRVKSEFLANMSHEIRTPLNGIMGMLQLLQMFDHDEEQNGYIQLAMKSSERLTRLLSDILDISRIEAGKLALRFEEFPIPELCESVMTFFDRTAMEKGLSLECRTAPELPPVVVGDETRVIQVLSNLVGNAIKFTEFGRVAVDIGSSPQTDGNIWLKFTITDTGIGIPKDKQESLFIPFYQVDGTGTRHYQGAGLGLTIVQRLVALMQGKLTLTSTLDQGTTVSVELPFSLPQAKKVNTQNSDFVQNPSTALRILLAEDDRINQAAVSGLVKKMGHEVTVAENGQQALDFVQEREFDLILMDVQMPVMNGVEAAENIRNLIADGMIKDIPVVAITAHAMAGDKERLLAQGLADYISKPVDIKDLARVISACGTCKESS